MIASLFKSRKPKKFELRTRYYDAEKEAFQMRVNLSKNAGTNTADRMRLSFRAHRRKKSTVAEASVLRVAVIAIALVLMALYIFF